MLAKTTHESPFVFAKGKDCFAWNPEGKKFLDFAAGIAVMNAGHSNPAVVKAVQSQLKLGSHAAFTDFYAEKPIEFAEELFRHLPKHFKGGKAFLSNSGTESVEAAIKCAKWASGKKTLLSFTPCFHGRTFGSLSMTNSKPVQREGLGPFLPTVHSPYPYCYRCPFGEKRESCSMECLEAFEKNLARNSEDCAAVFFEPISGEGGYIVPPKEFAKGMAGACSDTGTLLVCDEVQAGTYRTGKFLASEHLGIKPGMASMSKALGAGYPLGATVAKPRIMEWPNGVHSNTFGGNLIACAAGLAGLQFMKKKNLARNAERMGKIALERAKEWVEGFEIIGDARGIGLMIGIELVKDKKTKEFGVKERKKTMEECHKQGLLLLPCGTSSIRIVPPLTITKNNLEKGLDIMENAIKKADKNSKAL